MTSEPNPVDVIIVGGGYSGLSAAWALTSKGHSVVVLEARDRVGGRAWTTKFDNGWVDNGGQWIGPGMKAILELAEEVGVETFPTYNDGDTLLEFKGARARWAEEIPDAIGFPVPPEDVEDALNAIGLIDQLAKEVPPEAPWDAPSADEWDNQTLASWIDANVKTDGAKFAIKAIVDGYFSAETSDISLLHFLFYIATAGGVEKLEESSLAWRFDQGAQEIPNRLADRLGDRVRLNTPVRKIHQSDSEVTVETDTETFKAKRVIVALPPTMAMRIRYEPKLTTARDQYMQRAPMGSTIKCHAVYPRAFWRDDNLNGQIVTEGEINITYDNSPPSGTPGILVGFLEGKAAREWGDRSEDDIKAAMIDTFVNYFGEAARNPTDYFHANWADEEWSRGCYAGLPTPGTWTNFRDALRKPVGRIHWAGTETSTVWAQYMEGAVQSGQRAAAEINVALADGVN